MTNKKRLIDADDLYKAVQTASEGHGFYREFYDGFLNCIKRSPTVDAVEVVRCRDCKHCKQFKRYECLLTEKIVRLDDFCSHGERRSGTQPQRENDNDEA